MITLLNRCCLVKLFQKWPLNCFSSWFFFHSGKTELIYISVLLFSPQKRHISLFLCSRRAPYFICSPCICAIWHLTHPFPAEAVRPCFFPGVICSRPLFMAHRKLPPDLALIHTHVCSLSGNTKKSRHEKTSQSSRKYLVRCNSTLAEEWSRWPNLFCPPPPFFTICYHCYFSAFWRELSYFLTTRSGPSRTRAS